MENLLLSLFGLAIMGSWGYTHYKSFEGFMEAPMFNKIVLIFSVATFVLYVIGNSFNS